MIGELPKFSFIVSEAVANRSINSSFALPTLPGFCFNNCLVMRIPIVRITCADDSHNLCSDFFLFHIAFVFVVVGAKIATISIFPKNILLSLIKISVQYLKIAMLYLKISGLKIAVHSLKIAGLKIIARVCVYACMRVCPFCRGQQNSTGCTQSRNTSTRATTEHRNTSDHHKSRSTEHKHRNAATGARAPAHAHPSTRV